MNSKLGCKGSYLFYSYNFLEKIFSRILWIFTKK